MARRLGTLTIDFAPLEGADPAAIEVFRGLPILVTVFIVFSACPNLHRAQSTPSAAAIAPSSRAARRSPRPRAAGPVDPAQQHEAAAALGFGWTGSHALRDPAAGTAPATPALVSLLVNIIQNRRSPK